MDIGTDPAAAALRVSGRGLCNYEALWQEMQAFTAARDPDTPDELWWLEHPPVFTLGMNGKTEHLLAPGDIPVIAVDRGGQVTYHGPGQMVAYFMLDLRRLGMGVRQLVDVLEQSVIGWLATRGVVAKGRRDAPGVYVDGAKIAALGLRVRRGCTYHGLSLNVNMDLEPFSRINPCGYQGLPVTQLRDLGIDLPVPRVAEEWLPGAAARLGFTHMVPGSGQDRKVNNVG
jgi:lipoyl(octanoyl) transferase